MYLVNDQPFTTKWFQENKISQQYDCTNEPPHDKTNKMACAPSEDSDQPGHPPSLISLRCPHEESFGPLLPIERTAKTLISLGGCQADLILRWAQSFFLFCHEVAHMLRTLGKTVHSVQCISHIYNMMGVLCSFNKSRNVFVSYGRFSTVLTVVVFVFESIN